MSRSSAKNLFLVTFSKSTWCNAGERNGVVTLRVFYARILRIAHLANAAQRRNSQKKKGLSPAHFFSKQINKITQGSKKCTQVKGHNAMNVEMYAR